MNQTLITILIITTFLFQYSINNAFASSFENVLDELKECELSKHFISSQINMNLNEQTKHTCSVCRLCQNGAFCRLINNTLLDNQSPSTSLTYPLNSNRSPIERTNDHALLSFINSVVHVQCFCVPGYTDHYCQEEINECLSSPCSNNATCVDLVNSYKCACPFGFTGQLCEINIDDCANNPCQSNGQCIDKVGDYHCECLPGRTGKTCSIDINECESNPCFNNGQCIDLLNRYIEFI
jgi:hypothetical protein